MSTYTIELNNVVKKLNDYQILKLLYYAKNLIKSERDNDGVDVKHSCRYGIANGLYNIPDSIDACNEEIADMFGV